MTLKPFYICSECDYQGSKKLGHVNTRSPYGDELCTGEVQPAFLSSDLIAEIEGRIKNCDTCATGVCPICLQLQSLLTSIKGTK